MAKKPSITEQAQAAAKEAQTGAEAAQAAASAIQRRSDEQRGVRFGPKIANWEWVEYAEQSARRARAYATQAAGAAQGHDIPQANAALRNAWSEANGAWSNAERAGAVPRYLRDEDARGSK